jgi:hypothetical protein
LPLPAKSSLESKINAFGNPLCQHDLAETFDYLVKGADIEARQHFGIFREDAGGYVIGTRWGVSQNIGPKARQLMLTPNKA